MKVINKISFVIIFIVIVFSWIWFWNHYDTQGFKPQDIGSAFNIYIALVTAFGIAGVVYTILLQQEQIKEQRSQIGEQNKERARDKFEQNFWSLYKMHRDIKNDIQSTNSNSVNNKDYFQELVIEIINTHNSLKTNPNYRESNTTESFIKIAYSKVYTNNVHILSHYYKNIQLIYGYISFHDNVNSNIDIEFYNQMFCSQLSNAEILLIALNGLHPTSKTPLNVTTESLEDYIVRYQIIKNLDRFGENYDNYFSFLENHDRYKTIYQI